MGAHESFGATLKRLRLATGLSQHELAERAGLSERGISDLERGVRRNPFPATARHLATALDLDESDRRQLFERVAASDSHAPGPDRFELPPELSTFVGRERELQHVEQALVDAVLVTIAGPGGAGKSRLALRLARRLADAGAFADGVYLIELAPLTDPALVPRAIATSLGIQELAGQLVVDVVVRVLRSKRMLLVLDNCEHLLPASTQVATELLHGCPEVRIVATSREPLGIGGEVVYRVPPLQVPADDRVSSLEGSEAGQLFLQRARAASSQFSLSDATAPAIAEICRRLDGLPLALELAAARMAAFAPAEVARRLDNVLHIATGGPRTAPLRQQTLEATIAWSYALLDESERSLYRRLAVFAGGFALEGVQAIAAGDLDAFDVLPRLISRSIVQVDPQPDGGVRYRLLETLRQFGYARLVESHELEDARERHVDYLIGLATSIGVGAPPGAYEPRLTPETDNMRAALGWALRSGRVELAARLGAGLWRWWTRPDRQAEGRTWLQGILAQPDQNLDPHLHHQVVIGLAYLCMLQGETAEAARLAETVRHYAIAARDCVLAAVAAGVVSAALAYLGQSDAAELSARESIAFAREAGLPWIEMLGLGTLGALALGRGDVDAADEFIRGGLRIAQEGVDPWTQGIALNNIGDLIRARGGSDAAGPAYEQAMALFQAMDSRHKYVPQGLLHNLGYVALARGDPQRAAQLFLESADIYRAVGTDRRGLAECTIGLACTAVRVDRVALAARLFGTAEAELERLGTFLTHANSTERDRGLAELELALGADKLAAGRLEGRDMSLEEALAEACVLISSGSSPAAVTPRGLAGELTAREYEVALLMARGYSNRQIATELVIAEKTAKNHVQRVLEKLGARSRAELAARATELGLTTSSARS